MQKFDTSNLPIVATITVAVKSMPEIPPKVYFAGPDVFHRDYSKWMEKTAATCKTLGFEPLFPYCPELNRPLDIFKFNRALIIQADYVVANVTSFRGPEPDSGTVWEIGFATGLGKHVIQFTEDQLLHTDRHQAADEQLEDAGGVRNRDYFYEDFGKMVNLMLSESNPLIGSGVDGALLLLRDYIIGDRWDLAGQPKKE